MQFSNNMNKAMKYAEEYAKKSGGIVGTEHLLAGILSVNSDATAVLNKYGINRANIPDFIKFDSNSNAVSISRNSRQAFLESERLAGAGEVTPTHVLMTILNSDCVARRVLQAYNINLSMLGRELKMLLGGGEKRTIMDPFNAIMNAFMGGGMEMSNGDGDGNYMNGEYNNMNGEEQGDSTLPKALQGIGNDLTAKAKAGKLDPVIGRGKEIDRIIQVLSRRTKNNPVLIGEAGVGKSAIIEGLAQAIVDGNVPDILRDKKIIELDMANVVAGTKYRGEFEEKLKTAIKAIQEDGNMILFIDEIHTIVKAGDSEGAMDAANIMKPMLARGELQTIGATTIDEYRKYIEKDPALERRFQPIMVDPPSVEDTKVILSGIREKYEKHHGVTITDSAINAAAVLSDRYISDRYLPDKAIDVIDEAASKKRIKNFVTPDNIKEMEDSMQRCEADIESAVRVEDYEKANQFKIKRDKLKADHAEAMKKWKESNKNVKLSIDEKDIADIISSWTNIPVSKITEKEADRLLHLEDILRKRVIGQEEAVSSVAKAVRRARAGLKDPKKPIGTFIFLGPTGVGKTELSKALAEAMFGDENLLIRIDMSEYMEKNDVSKLIGSAPGYVGYEEGGQLTEKVRRKPYSVVLFDEIEKAHPDVFNILLQLLDDGRLTDSHGRTVSFKNTIVIMTSNIGAKEIKNTKLGFGQASEEADYEAMKERQMEALKRTLKPEFINRIDDVIIFRSLNKNDTRAITNVLMDKLISRLKEQNIHIEVTDAAKDFVAEKGFNTEYGARPLNRAIQKYVEDAMSEQILMGKVALGDKVVVDFKDGALTFDKKPN